MPGGSKGDLVAQVVLKSECPGCFSGSSQVGTVILM